MPIERTLERVDALLAGGDLAGARVRLRSLVAHAPRRLDVRERLAEVYRREGAAQEAGRWGYLGEDVTPQELRAFARANGGDARRMMAALRWEGPEDGAGTPVAEERLRALRATAEDATGRPVDWADPLPGPEPASPWFDLVVLVVLLALGACVVVGAVTIVRWLVGLVG